MAKRNGFRIFVLTLVGAATLVCLVFTGLLVRLAIRTLNTSEEDIAMQKDKQETIDKQFADTFGQTDAPGAGFSGIEIDFGDMPAPPGSGAQMTIETPPATPVTPSKDTPTVVSGEGPTITIDIDAQGNASFAGEALTQDSLSAMLQAMGGEGNIVLDVHPSCEEEQAQLWWYVCYEAGYTAISQRVAKLPE